MGGHVVGGLVEIITFLESLEGDSEWNKME